MARITKDQLERVSSFLADTLYLKQKCPRMADLYHEQAEGAACAVMVLFDAETRNEIVRIANEKLAKGQTMFNTNK